MQFIFTLVGLALTALPFVIAIVVAIGCIWAVVATSVRPLWGAWVLAMAFLLETWFILAPQISLGIQVSSTDLASLLLMGGLFGRFLIGGIPFNRGFLLGWLTVGGFLFASGGLGLMKFGTMGGVELRENFYFWVAGFYFACYRYEPADLTRLWRVLLVVAWGVLAIAVYRWVGLAAGFVERSTFLLAGASSEFRAVGSTPALVVGVVGVVYFARWLESTRARDGLFAAWFLGFAVVFQHRTAWLALLTMLGILLFMRRERVFAVLPWLVMSTLISGGLIAVAMALGYMEGLAGALEKSVTTVTSGQSGTYTARAEGGMALLRDWLQYPARDFFFGKPYGSGFARYIGGQLNVFSPHNFYIELLLRIGLAGLLIWLGVLITLLWVASKSRMAHLDAARASLAFAVMVGWMVFYLGYQGNFFQGAGYGVAMALAMAGQRIGKKTGVIAVASPVHLAKRLHS